MGGLALLVVALSFFLSSPKDSREPPELRPAIPIIGHMIGMFRYTVFYYATLRGSSNVPIFTIVLPGSKMYIISSPPLITAIQKLTKAVSFATMAAKASGRVAGCSDAALEIINNNVDLSKGPESDSFVHSFFKAIVPPLRPGSSLDAMNRIMIENISGSTNALAKRTPTRINLAKWLRREITLATTNAVYGPENPYADEENEQAFWTYEQHIMLFMIGILPSITARKGLQARAKLADAFVQYFTKEAQAKASALAQMRYSCGREWGFSVEDIARFEPGNAIALLSNTFPTAYWMLYYIFSNPKVLEDCRQEIESATKINQGNGTATHTIDVSAIKASCPILASTLQEVLRYRSVGMSVREVLEDTLLDGQYLLKKGGTVVIPSNVLHTDPAHWGADVDDFNHRRFLTKTSNPVAFRAFGGGNTLCPGRHFASTEVMALVCMFIARFEMEPVGGWPSPVVTDVKIWAQIIEPHMDLEVDIRARDLGAGKHVWEFGLTDSELQFALAAEDK
ncbi:cytochrome P450 [Lophiotrema nucula]|uniref:Cytochrome P450 n=1 Tax=Lophiotrema nucula TaxID=690887 RepID=A0A6A5ZHF4_9PLEO|nr:cytochrome P450 [Lophiotrema nucula]